MSISMASPGASFVVDTRFLSVRGEPLAPKPTQPVVYEIRDPKQNLVLTGAAQQDSVDLARWYATVTLPDSLPSYPTTEKYCVAWLLRTTKRDYVSKEFFAVESVGDNLYTASDLLVIKGGTVYDTIRVSAAWGLTPAAFTVTFMDGQGSVLYRVPKSDITKLQTTGDVDIFGYEMPTTSLPSRAFASTDALLVSWEISSPTHGMSFEVHFVYIATPASLIAVNDLRRAIDKARNVDINPNLQMTDLDLHHYLRMGLQRVNAAPPQPTDYLFENVPMNLRVAVQEASRYEALRAQYLAEGVSAFDFSGQSVSLTVDRTQYLESEMGRIQAYLDTTLPQVKKASVIAGSPGAVSIQIHSRTNRLYDATRTLTRVLTPHGRG